MRISSQWVSSMGMTQIACCSVTVGSSDFSDELAGFAIDGRQHGAAFSNRHVIGFCPRLQDIEFDAVFAFHRFERRAFS